ncbi:MAG: HlyD family efflux transporter periplasmic adaptor subunit [Clostridia bacterium]|nr:HlyD family efflux transporter periplasmic adaptor subunit [Clostridia bacterium]
MKNLKRVVIVIAIIAIVVFILVNIVKSKIGAVQDAESGYASYMFDTYTVKRGDVSSYIKGVGQITSFNIETLEIGATDKISEILVSEGTRVEKNQDVMKVTDLNNKTRTIKAGISGNFYCIETEEATKYCIYNLDDIGVKLSLPEKDITHIAIGQTVTVKVNALDKEFSGTVSYIASLPQNDRYTVRIKIDYTDDIKFGYSSTASILIANMGDVISIPYDYLKMDEDDRYYVFKEEYKQELYNAMFDGTPDEAYRTYVEVGIITSNNVEIKSGLAEGDKILTQVW